MQIVGIDLAKASFDVTLLSTAASQQHSTFANTPEGFKQLQAWLHSHGVSELHACMEATNVYWEALAAFLHAQGYTVSVVNPARIKGFAQATMQRNKTDKLDSAIIAQFCLRHTPDAWQPQSDEQRHLRALMRHREDLLLSKLQQENRLRDTTNSVVRASLEAVLEAILVQLKAVEKTVAEHIASNAELKANAALLTSIVGIGAITASKLLSEFADLAKYETAKAAAADAGLTPAQVESGTSVRRRPKMSKMGKAGIRAALYLPAITAMRRCPSMKAFADRLAARGKAKLVVIGAVMRKLVHIAYGVLKHRTPYDPDKVLGRASTST